MSNVVKGNDPDKVVFAFQPKPFQVGVSAIAKDFVDRENLSQGGFEVSAIVSQAAGIQELKRKQAEAELEEVVLARMKEIEEEAYKKAYELGLIEGREKAFQEKTADIEAQLAQVATLTEQMSHMKSQLLQQSETFFIKLIFQIASKIALFEIKENREPLVDFIKPLIDATEADDRVVVNVSQEDFDFIHELETRTGKKISIEKAKLVASSEIQPGGCIIESNFGSIDASVETRVQKAWHALEAKLPRLKGHHTDLKPSNEGSGDPA